MRNLTTTALGEKRVKQRQASQSPLRIHSVQLGVVKELDSDKVTFHEVPIASQGEAQPGNVFSLFCFASLDIRSHVYVRT